MSDTAVAESGTRLQNFLDRAGLRGFPWKTSAILYTISWGWLLIAGEIDVLNEPLYWRFNVINSNLLGFAPWHDFFYTDFFDFVFPHYSEFVFLAHFVVGICSFAIIGSLKFLERSQVEFFILLVLLVPFNTARVSSMTIVYTCGLLIFAIAWVLLVRAESKAVKLLSFLSIFRNSFACVFLCATSCAPIFEQPTEKCQHRNHLVKKKFNVILATCNLCRVASCILDRRP